MKSPALQSSETNLLPRLSSQTLGWESILVEQFQPAAGEGNCYYSDEHMLFLSLSPRPVRLLMKTQGGKSYTGSYGKGDIAIAPASTPLFARWDSDDHYLRVRLPARFMQSVARETIALDPDRLELMPTWRVRNPQIEAIGMMLFNELQQKQASNNLYIDSLANILTVNLLRQYTTAQPRLSIYEGGLPQRQLCRVLDYIDTYLDQKIKLADLAQLLDISQFHFSHLFKQSMGISPHQYLLQQRVERAKQMLKQTDRSIVEIALECGFNSHSHLSKQFRQLIGITPSAYRAN
jgi:AraC family transcriptional regulator